MGFVNDKIYDHYPDRPCSLTFIHIILWDVKVLEIKSIIKYVLRVYMPLNVIKHMQLLI